MASFDLDVAFAPDDVVSGLEKLLSRRGLRWSRTAGRGQRYEFLVELPGGTQALITVAPVPVELQTYASFFSRTLVEARAEDAAALETLRREIILAFLRVMG